MGCRSRRHMDVFSGVSKRGMGKMWNVDDDQSSFAVCTAAVLTTIICVFCPWKRRQRWHVTGNCSSWCHWVHSVLLLKRRVERILIECPAFGCATESNTDYQECDVFVTAEKFHTETLSDVLGMMWSPSRLYFTVRRRACLSQASARSTESVMCAPDVVNRMCGTRRRRGILAHTRRPKSSTVGCIPR